MHAKVWDYRPGTGFGEGTSVVGFRVQAQDGRVGRVTELGREETLGGYLVVATGWPLRGGRRHVVLPVGAVSMVDLDRSTVHVDRTRAEIRDAPEYEHLHVPPETDYLGHLGHYYGQFYAGGKV